MKQKLLSFLLALLPIMASADAVEIDGICYNLIPKGNAAQVVSNPKKYSGDVVIPESIEYGGLPYEVTTICGGAFYDCLELTSITIPKTIKSIENTAAFSFNSFPLYNIYISDLEA